MRARIEMNANRRESEKGAYYSVATTETDMFVNLRDWKILLFVNENNGQRPQLVLMPRRDNAQDDVRDESFREDR